jgi:phosphoserine/homoserine phosphotransferase
VLIVTDLEGVLVPEIWVEIARVTGVPDLRLTTHDEPDFEALMRKRVEVLDRVGIRLPDLQRIAGNMLPYPGATDFLAWARTKGQVLIVSDTFHELSEPLVQLMGGYSLFANTFRTDVEGRVLGYRLRIRGRKDKVIRSLKEIGYRIVAIGDGWNDELMLRLAHDPILYRGPDTLAARLPRARRASTFEDLRQIILEAHDELTSANFVEEAPESR